MHFEIVGTIRNVQIIAVGQRIRQLDRLKKLFGKGRWRKMKGEAMSAKKKSSRRYAVCIRNEGNEASLERNKLYVVLPDRRAAADGLVRVIDEDGGE